jgi:hypothetical protein
VHRLLCARQVRGRRVWMVCSGHKVEGVAEPHKAVSVGAVYTSNCGQAFAFHALRFQTFGKTQA